MAVNVSTTEIPFFLVEYSTPLYDRLSFITMNWVGNLPPQTKWIGWDMYVWHSHCQRSEPKTYWWQIDPVHHQLRGLKGRPWVAKHQGLGLYHWAGVKDNMKPDVILNTHWVLQTPSYSSCSVESCSLWSSSVGSSAHWGPVSVAREGLLSGMEWWVWWEVKEKWNQFSRGQAVTWYQ